jgi:LacI family transcriptional regulator
MARGLVSRRSRVLGVVSFDTILFGPASTLLGIERAARVANYGVSIVTLERVDRASVLSAIDILADQGVDGVIIIAPQISAAAALHNLPGGLVAVAPVPCMLHATQVLDVLWVARDYIGG